MFVGLEKYWIRFDDAFLINIIFIMLYKLFGSTLYITLCGSIINICITSFIFSWNILGNPVTLSVLVPLSEGYSLWSSEFKQSSECFLFSFPFFWKVIFKYRILVLLYLFSFYKLTQWKNRDWRMTFSN